MNDLISKSKLIEEILEEANTKILDLESGITLGEMKEWVDNQPTVEAVSVVHGCVKTVVGKMGVMHQECSACGNVLEWKAYPNYCDECGAKLDGAAMRTSAE